MPIQDRFVHDLAIVTPSRDADVVDDYGQPVEGDPVTVLVSGLIQPKLAREIALISQAGGQLSDHTVFLSRRDLAGAAYIRYEPDDGDRYEITGIRDFNYGTVNDHLEVDCRRVVSEVLAVEAS